MVQIRIRSRSAVKDTGNKRYFCASGAYGKLKRLLKRKIRIKKNARYWLSFKRFDPLFFTHPRSYSDGEPHHLPYWHDDL
jgi:hypothetical protein